MEHNVYRTPRRLADRGGELRAGPAPRVHHQPDVDQEVGEQAAGLELQGAEAADGSAVHGSEILGRGMCVSILLDSSGHENPHRMMGVTEKLATSAFERHHSCHTFGAVLTNVAPMAIQQAYFFLPWRDSWQERRDTKKMRDGISTEHDHRQGAHDPDEVAQQEVIRGRGAGVHLVAEARGHLFSEGSERGRGVLAWIAGGVMHR